MSNQKDGSCTKHFKPVLLKGNVDLSRLPQTGVSCEMRDKVQHAPHGSFVAWGLPFRVGSKAVLLRKEAVMVKLAPVKSSWLASICLPM